MSFLQRLSIIRTFYFIERRPTWFNNKTNEGKRSENRVQHTQIVLNYVFIVNTLLKLRERERIKNFSFIQINKLS